MHFYKYLCVCLVYNMNWMDTLDWIVRYFLSATPMGIYVRPYFFSSGVMVNSHGCRVHKSAKQIKIEMNSAVIKIVILLKHKCIQCKSQQAELKNVQGVFVVKRDRSLHVCCINNFKENIWIEFLHKMRQHQWSY